MYVVNKINRDEMMGMELHSTFTISEYTSIIRVVNGWIYKFCDQIDRGGNFEIEYHFNTIFIPETPSIPLPTWE